MGKRSRSKREIRATETPRAESAPRSVLSPQSSVLIAAALAIAVLAVCAQVARHDFINFADPDYVVSNPHVSSGLTAANTAWAFTHYHAPNWHPLTWISHMVDVSLFAIDA